MNKYKYALTGGIILLITGAASYLNQTQDSAHLMHSNTFTIGHELMEAMEQCPFEQKEKCQIFIEECRFVIDSGEKQITPKSIAECKFKVETLYEEICEGIDCNNQE